MFVSFVCCVGSGLCDELISRSEDRCVCACVRDLESLTMRWSRSDLGSCDTKMSCRELIPIYSEHLYGT